MTDQNLEAINDTKSNLSKHSLIEFKSVCKSFKTNNSSVEVLHDVSFSIPLGSFTILYGPSGSGKSTILNTITGLEKPTSGTVCINGVDLYSLSSDNLAQVRSHLLGMVHQYNYWVNSLSTLENIALPLYLAGWKRPESRSYALESIRRVGLEEFAHYHPNLLSGGQQQRMSFARATAKKPSILVADEPTGNLDSVSGSQIIELLESYNKEHGSTIILVTHNEEFLPYANNLLTIRDGVVTQKESKSKKSLKQKQL